MINAPIRSHEGAADDPVALGIEIVVSGHSLVPKIETIGGVLYLNPGTAALSIANYRRYARRDVGRYGPDHP